VASEPTGGQTLPSEGYGSSASEGVSTKVASSCCGHGRGDGQDISRPPAARRGESFRWSALGLGSCWGVCGLPPDLGTWWSTSPGALVTVFVDDTDDNDSVESVDTSGALCARAKIPVLPGSGCAAGSDSISAVPAAPVVPMALLGSSTRGGPEGGGSDLVWGNSIGAAAVPKASVWLASAGSAGGGANPAGKAASERPDEDRVSKPVAAVAMVGVVMADGTASEQANTAAPDEGVVAVAVAGVAVVGVGVCGEDGRPGGCMKVAVCAGAVAVGGCKAAEATAGACKSKSPWR